MEQSKALNALEPFLALTKSATSPRAAADLIQRATSAPNTYIFASLLATPSIAALASDPEYAPHLTHLELFSSGLYSTYISTPGLPPLNDAQALKLRQLSLLTLSRERAALSYPALMDRLGLATPRELEDVVISAVYAGLLAAKLNPARQQVQVSSVAPLRDVQPASVGSIVATLKRWSERCDATLAEIEGTVASIREEAARNAERQRESQRSVQSALDEVEKNGGLDGLIVGTTVGGAGAGTGGHARRRPGGAGSGRAGGLRSQGGAGGAKRGSEKLMEATTGADEDDEAMDLDDDTAVLPGQKRASRRKL